MYQNYISMSKLKYLILFLFLLVCPVYSQTSKNYAETIPDYVYGLGKGVGRALANNCSAALTTIEEVKVIQSPDFGNTDIINAKLSVVEYYRFADNAKKPKREINVSYNKPRKTRIKPTGQSWEWYLLIDMTEGNKAMVFECSLGLAPFVTTDSTYFGKIKQAIELTEKFRVDYVNVLNYFANDFNSDDELRKGAALNFLLGTSGIPRDVRTYICVDLLNEFPASKQKDGVSVKLGIQNSLAVDSLRDAPPEFRSQSFIKLVKIANGENENAIDATEILAWIAMVNSNELRPFLKSGNTENIGANLRKINIKGDAFSPEPLMKMLSEQ